MTLIEIMIVVALMAMLMATLVFGSGMFIGASRRAAATLVVAAVRKGLAHANTTGKPVRLAIDLSAGRLTLEESNSMSALKQDSADLPEPPDDPEAAFEQTMVSDAEALGESFLAGAGDADSGFTPVAELAGEEDQPGRSLDSSVKIRLVQTEHDSEPIIEGTAYLYFWPGGVTERAVVQLGSGADDDGLTVEVSPLTGRAKVRRGRIDLPEPRFSDESYSEREEP